jgi:hypothetical protein
VFAGDFIWKDLFLPYFNRSYPFSSFNVNDLDSHDRATVSEFLRELGE